MHTTSDGKPHQTQFYNPDAIISLGYRVNSKKDTQFRIWATGVLKQSIKDGFAINEELLRSDPDKLNRLAGKFREHRANKKNVYCLNGLPPLKPPAPLIDPTALCGGQER